MKTFLILYLSINAVISAILWGFRYLDKDMWNIIIKYNSKRYIAAITIIEIIVMPFYIIYCAIMATKNEKI